ncbi:unnamed protein product, partial [Urochloa humidicola]
TDAFGPVPPQSLSLSSSSDPRAPSPPTAPALPTSPSTVTAPSSHALPQPPHPRLHLPFADPASPPPHDASSVASLPRYRRQRLEVGGVGEGGDRRAR